MKTNWVPIITSLVTPIAIILVFKLLGKAKNLKVAEKAEKLQVTEEQQRLYKQYVGWGGLIIIATGIAIGFPIYYLLVGVAQLYFSFMQPYDAIYAMPNAAIGIPALFLAILALIAPTKYLSIKYYGKENYQIFTQLTDQQYGFDSEKFGKIMVKWGVIICALFYANVLKTTSYVFHDKVKLMGFSSLEAKDYPLKEIKEIVVATKQKASNGNVVFRPRYYIVFNDGFQWDLDDEGDSKEFIRMLQFKTGAKVREVEFML